MAQPLVDGTMTDTVALDASLNVTDVNAMSDLAQAKDNTEFWTFEIIVIFGLSALLCLAAGYKMQSLMRNCRQGKEKQLADVVHNASPRSSIRLKNPDKLGHQRTETPIPQGSMTFDQSIDIDTGSSGDSHDLYQHRENVMGLSTVDEGTPASGMSPDDSEHIEDHNGYRTNMELPRLDAEDRSETTLPRPYTIELEDNRTSSNIPV